MIRLKSLKGICAGLYRTSGHALSEIMTANNLLCVSYLPTPAAEHSFHGQQTRLYLACSDPLHTVSPVVAARSIHITVSSLQPFLPETECYT